MSQRPVLAKAATGIGLAGLHPPALKPAAVSPAIARRTRSHPFAYRLDEVAERLDTEGSSSCPGWVPQPLVHTAGDDEAPACQGASVQ